MRCLCLTLILPALALWGCSLTRSLDEYEQGSPVADAGTDVLTDAPIDAPIDAPVDAPTDVAQDPSDLPDVAPDGSGDVAADHVEMCPEGLADCDGHPNNGCEVSLATDPSNCGACGRACEDGFTCETSLCSCTHHEDCDHGGGGKCFVSGAIKICECGGVACDPGEVCLPGEICGQN